MSECVQLDAYLSGGLAGARLAAFEDHLEHCADCRNEFEAWRDLQTDMADWANWKVLPAPTGAEAASLVVGLQPRKAALSWRMPAVYAGLAFVSVIAIVFVALYQSGQPDPDPLSVANPAVVEAVTPKPDSAEDLSPASLPAAPTKIRVLFSRQSEIVRRTDTSPETLLVPEEGHLLVMLGQDRIGLSGRSRLQVLNAASDKTRIRLVEGRVAAEVAPRHDEGFFEIVAGPFVVRVVGTRFDVDLVSPSQIRVGVAEGTVVVSGADEGLHEVKQGQVLAFGADRAWRMATLAAEDDSRLDRALSGTETGAPVADSAPTPVRRASAQTRSSTAGPARVSAPAAAEVEEAPESAQPVGPKRDATAWRRLILKGQYPEAEGAIVDYLEAAPRDPGAWSLLASCRRKARNWEGAFDAYRQVIACGDVRTANRARFDAAVILQDKLQRNDLAGELLSQYLEAPLLLEAEAMVRLARIYLEQGREAHAESLLDQVLVRHGSTSAAVQARDLLNNLDGSRR